MDDNFERFMQEVEHTLKQAVPILDLSLNKHGVEILGIVGSIAANYVLTQQGDPEVQAAAQNALDSIIKLTEETDHIKCVLDFTNGMVETTIAILDHYEEAHPDEV
jgi:hypothetical protein